MSLLRGPEKRIYSGGAFNPYGPPNWTIPSNGQAPFADMGFGMNPDLALRHPAVWASVRIIADTVAQCPVDVLSGESEPVDPLPTKITKPSAYATWIQWIQQVMISALLDGNAYGMIGQTDRLGYPSQVDLIAPKTVTAVNRDKRGRKEFNIAGKLLDDQQVWHFTGPQMPGELKGMSPIRYAAQAIRLGQSAAEFGSDFFANGVNPSAVAESDREISREQAQTIKERIKSAVANRDLAVLGLGLHLKEWQLNADEAQFLETQRFQSVMIAQYFGVPPEMIGAAVRGSTITYANREQRAQDFLTNAVNPWLVRLEEALSAWFPRGTYVKFNTGALLRSDLITRFQAYAIGIGAEFMLKSEARDFENWPDVPGIDDKEPAVIATQPADNPVPGGKTPLVAVPQA